MDVEVVDPEGTGECRESRTSAMLLPAAPKGRGQVGARTRTITAGALVLVGLAVVCAFGGVSFWVVDGWGRFATRAWGTSLQTSLEWSGGGRFLVAQLRERQGQPLASAWDRQTGATRTLEGYRVLAVEKEGAFAWVVKDPGHTIPGVKTLSIDERKIFFLGMFVADTASDFLDGPVSSGLSRWDLASGELSAAAQAGRWADWVGSTGTRAELTVDASRGAWPSTIRFTGVGLAKAVEARLGATGTVIPLGWTDDGRAFAVAHCVSWRAVAEHSGEASRPVGISTTVSLLSAIDGSVLASAVVESMPSDAVSSHVSLDPSRGELVIGTGERLMNQRIVSISASMGIRPVSLPPRADTATPTVPLWLVGYDGSGVRFVAHRAANPGPRPGKEWDAKRMGFPWPIWRTRGTDSEWVEWMGWSSQMTKTYDRGAGMAWTRITDFPSRPDWLTALAPDPVTGTEDVMWSPDPRVPAKKVLGGYYSFIF